MTRSRLIRSATLVCLFTAASTGVRAQNDPAKPVNDPAKMKRLLNEWERIGDMLKTLDVHIHFKVKANEAEARYQMSLVSENADKYLVKVLPKLKEDQKSFKVAWLHLDKQFLLPTRITLISPDGIGSREYYLDRQRPNAPVDDQSFQGGVLPGWTVQKNAATGQYFSRQ